MNPLTLTGDLARSAFGLGLGFGLVCVFSSFLLFCALLFLFAFTLILASYYLILCFIILCFILYFLTLIFPFNLYLDF